MRSEKRQCGVDRHARVDRRRFPLRKTGPHRRALRHSRQRDASESRFRLPAAACAVSTRKAISRDLRKRESTTNRSEVLKARPPPTHYRRCRPAHAGLKLTPFNGQLSASITAVRSHRSPLSPARKLNWSGAAVTNTARRIECLKNAAEAPKSVPIEHGEAPKSAWISMNRLFTPAVPRAASRKPIIVNPILAG
jgi:hypothetical protein